MQDSVIPVTFGVLIPLAAFVHSMSGGRKKVDFKMQNKRHVDEFSEFQTNYVCVFLILMTADWMQGAYVYQVYSEYGFDQGQIGMLFVSGYLTTAICGPLIGAVADTYGRKKMCIFYCFAYSITCLSMRFNNIFVLFFGRIFGGISTSILFSCLESWMITEHYKKSFSEANLSKTFSISWRWNGVVAVVSGFSTGFATRFFGTPIAAFDCANVMLMLGAAIIGLTWEENYGEQIEDECNNTLAKTLTRALVEMHRDPCILVLGSIQSLFESAMYIFVFMWTSALDTVSEGEINHGYIFACFMLACMVGTQVSCVLAERWKIETCFNCLLALAIVSTVVTSQVHNFAVRFVMLTLFEFTVGAYWHLIGVQRAKYIPDGIRTTVMNLFQIPLNLIVILCLLNASSLSIETAFLICAMLHSLALIMQQVLDPEEVVVSYIPKAVPDYFQYDFGDMKTWGHGRDGG